MNPTPPPAKSPGQPLITVREIVIVAGALLFLQIAFRLFDEMRGALRGITQLLIAGLVVFFGGRALWRWWRRQRTSIAWIGVRAALGVAVAGWLDLLLVRAVVAMPGDNYALIIIVPLMMIMAFLVSLAGLLGAAVCLAAVVAAATRPMPRASLILVGGIWAIILNLAHICFLVLILNGGNGD